MAVASYDTPFNPVEADLLLLKWMVGVIWVGVLSLVPKTFFTG